MRALRYFIAICLLLVLAAGVFVYSAWRPAIEPIKPPAASSFDSELVKRGAELAAIGDCEVCHTAAGGRVFAGGLGLPTPFGTIFSTNITPDVETGIGNWSEAAFQRAMREGVRRDGAYLYPAFPYDHFTLVSDDDDRALYAFLMTREPVHVVARANALPFPLNVRLLMFGSISCFFIMALIAPTRRRAKRSIAAPISPKGLATAAPVTRREIFWAQRRGKRNLPARKLKVGRPTR